MRREVMEYVKLEAENFYDTRLRTIKQMTPEEATLEEFKAVIIERDTNNQIEYGYYNQCPEPYTNEEFNGFIEVFTKYPELTDECNTVNEAFNIVSETFYRMRDINKALTQINKIGIEEFKKRQEPRDDGHYDNNFYIKYKNKLILRALEKTESRDVFDLYKLFVSEKEADENERKQNKK